jgi:hypothetical protein
LRVVAVAAIAQRCSGLQPAQNCQKVFSFPISTPWRIRRSHRLAEKSVPLERVFGNAINRLEQII